MKKLLTTFSFIIGILSMMNAQWVSPGNGTIYTLPDLVEATNGVVTNVNYVYTIHDDITISENDILKIDANVTRIDAPGVLITIKGSMVCNNSDRVKLYGTEQEQFSMRFENATGCRIKKMYFSDGCGIKLIESDVTFDDVKFVYFTRDYSNAVIDIFNCNPTIKNCYFMLNKGAAISSPANGQSSPQILNCEFDTNVDGINSPQINLGPGADDTIRIVGNEIYTIMASWYVGGIAISDLLGTGSTKVLLEDNIIKEGRYGYNQQGMNISSVINRNQFINNYHEENPMNGGSGISIYGYSTDCKAKLRGNIITGNLWGITAIYMHDIDLGTEDEWGYNQIHDNSNSGTLYELYNNASCDIMAVGNDWGTTNEQEVEERIYHKNDNPEYGLVTFIPFVGYNAVSESLPHGMEISPNPVSNGAMTLTLNEATSLEMAIYNLNGQKVLSQRIENLNNHIDVSMLKRGVYFVELKNTEKSMVKRIIID